MTHIKEQLSEELRGADVKFYNIKAVRLIGDRVFCHGPHTPAALIPELQVPQRFPDPHIRFSCPESGCPTSMTIRQGGLAEEIWEGIIDTYEETTGPDMYRALGTGERFSPFGQVRKLFRTPIHLN